MAEVPAWGSVRPSSVELSGGAELPARYLLLTIYVVTLFDA